jgi:hypothetical protein
MLGNTLTLKLDDGDQIVTKISQDGYGSEYLKVGTTDEYRVRVRHSRSPNKATGQVYDRHNVEVVRTVYAAADVPEYYQKAYFVFEQKRGDQDIELMDGLCNTALATSSALLTSIIGWES